MFSHLQETLLARYVEGVEDISEKELADLINRSFLEPIEEYRLDLPLSKLPVEEYSLFLEVSEARMQSLLANLNPSKASGPDSIPNWLLKEYADFLCRPLTVIFNASFKEQRLPQIWEMDDVTPLPKTKPLKELKKDLRPISLTACLSKVAEECMCRGRLCQASCSQSTRSQSVWRSSQFVHNSGSDSYGSPLVKRD